MYELAKLRKQQQEELDARDEYHMPAAYDAEGAERSSRYEVLTARYKCARVSHSSAQFPLHAAQCCQQFDSCPDRFRGRSDRGTCLHAR